MANGRELLAEISDPAMGGGSRFGSVVGMPGVCLGLDPIDR
jgi:hypothetical protein